MTLCPTCQTPLELRGSRHFCPGCLLRDILDEDEETPVTQLQQLPLTPVPGMEQPAGLPRVARYHLIEQLGEGGFATVYRANQTEPVRREVALKVLKAQVASEHVLARFETERQTLARMEHPGIAQLWDAGMTEDGLPFFAMELLRGVPITTHCTQHQAPLRERLQLFQSICAAVQHAHEKGVMHRDLKPSNILVVQSAGAPVVKVIDFGIAKAVASVEGSDAVITRIHQALGTPGYMSPEQAEWGEQQVDARSDLYGLGVVLYELLTGSTPLQMERGLDPTARRRPVAAHVIPPSRSTSSLQRSRHEQRDLDAIVMKALEYDSALRYPSAASLAEDVQRHLNDEPVLAGNFTWTYVTQKFARRHKPLVAAVGVALFSVFTALGISSFMYLKEQQTRSGLERTQAELRHTLSRADFQSAQRLRQEGDYQGAAAYLVRSLRQEPGFSAAATSLQLILSQEDSPQPMQSAIPLDASWGAVDEQKCAVSADGNGLAVGFKLDRGHRLMLFRFLDGRWQSQSLPVTGTLAALAISASGDALVWADDSQNLYQLDLRDHSAAPLTWSAPGVVTHISLAARGGNALLGAKDGSVWSMGRLVDKKPQMVAQLPGAVTEILRVAGKPYFFVASGTGAVWRVNPSDESQNTEWFKMPAAITTMQALASADILVMGDHSGNIAAASVAEAGKVTVPITQLHQGTVTTLALASHGESLHLVSAGGPRDLRVRWYDLRRQTDVQRPIESAGSVRRLLIRPGYDGVFIINADASVRLWRQSGGSVLTSRKPQRARLIATSGPGRAIALQRDSGAALEVLRITSHTLPNVILETKHAPGEASHTPTILAFVSRDNRFVHSSGGHALSSWQTDSPVPVTQVEWKKPALDLTVPQPGGPMLFAALDGSLLTGKPGDPQPTVLVPPDPKQQHWHLAAISPDGGSAVWSMTNDNTLVAMEVRVWSAAENRLRSLTVARLSSLATHSGNQLLAYGLQNGHVRLLKLDGERATYQPLHQSAVTSLAYSPAGDLLLSGASDGSAALWGGKNLAPVGDYIYLGAPVRKVCFSGDGQRFACASASQIFVGDVETRALIGQPYTASGSGEALALNHDGTRLVATVGEGETIVRDLPPMEHALAPEWFLQFAEAYVSRRVTPLGAMEMLEHPGREALRTLIQGNPQDEWTRLALWLLQHTGLRTLSPWSPLTLEDYLQQIPSEPSPVREAERIRLEQLRHHSPEPREPAFPSAE